MVGYGLAWTELRMVGHDKSVDGTALFALLPSCSTNKLFMPLMYFRRFSWPFEAGGISKSLPRRRQL
jgi:hypothetical protein